MLFYFYFKILPVLTVIIIITIIKSNAIRNIQILLFILKLERTAKDGSGSASIFKRIVPAVSYTQLTLPTKRIV